MIYAVSLGGIDQATAVAPQLARLRAELASD
jgi:hypothetical protein